MSNIREGDVKVYCLKMDVKKAMSVLRNKGYRSRLGSIEYTSRVERQIRDGQRFLEMLDLSPYSRCKTVDELKQRISRTRNTLKIRLSELDPEADGHQLSMFEVLEEISEPERENRKKAIAELKDEIHWLHKCLGICKNRDYFN